MSSAEDVAALVKVLVMRDSSPHPAYNVATPPTTMRDIAEIVRRYIPDARIEFGRQAMPPEAAKTGLPWRVSMARAREDLGFSLLPLEEVVRRHIEDARGDPPIH